MKIDIYTKTILTAIAIALFWIAAALTAPAKATDAIQQFDIVKVGGKWIDRSIPVEMK